MKQTIKYKKKFFFNTLWIIFCFTQIPSSTTQAETENSSESLMELSGLPINGKMHQTIQNLSPEQRQNALGKAQSLLPAQRQQALQNYSNRSTNQPLESKINNQRNHTNRGKHRTQTNDFASKTDILDTDDQRTKEAIYDLFPPELTLFGQDLFVNAPNSFIPDTNIPIPDDYHLGPGDSVLVQLSGEIFKQYTLIIDREGMFTFPGIGPLSVIGLHFQALKEMLQERVQQQMLETKIARVTLATLRSMQVFVLGDVPHPGSYTVNSLTTVTNALFSSGGIKPIGSLRNIQIKRQGKTVATLDMYHLLLHGNQSGDIRLQSGDIIFVPPIGSVIAVTGRVKRPGIYELRSENKIETAINLAGGLLPDADPSQVKVDRFKARKKRILLDMDLTKKKQLRSRVQSGDTIHIPAVSNTKKNIVTLTGAAANTGEYQWYKGVHLADIVIFQKLLPQVDLSYSVVTRLEAKTGRFAPLTLNLGRALEDPSSPDNIALKPGDTIQIFNLDENHANSVQTLVNHLQGQARYDHQEHVVSLLGHVRYPGDYPYSPNMGLKDLLLAAGDIKIGADMTYSLIVRFNQQGEINLFSVSLNQILAKNSTTQTILLQPMDQVLVFSDNPSKDEKNNNQINVIDAVKEMIDDIENEEDINEKTATNSDIINKYSYNSKLSEKNKKNKNKVDKKRRETTQEDEREEYKTYASRYQLLQPVLTKLRQQGKSGFPTRIVLINGAVRSPGKYPLETNMRVSDLIRAGGHMTEPAYVLDAELSRFSTIQGQRREISHQKIELAKIIQGDTVADILLQPHDVLQIKRTPQWSTVNSVTFEGELRFPGTYPVKPGETLLQVLERAGGLTPYAYPDGAIFLRKSLKKREKREFDALTSRLEMEIVGSALQSKDKDKEDRNTSSLLLNLVNKLRSTTPQGRLAIDLPKMLANRSNEQINETIILRDKDYLLIPQKINEITVLGEVYYPTSHQYLTTNTIEKYANLSGGYSQMADLDHIYVVKANGQVISNNPTTSLLGSSWLSGSSRDIPLTPGDTIVVPMKIEHIAPMVLWKDISQVIYNIAVTSATLKTVGVF